jgi:hypothetical protein
VDRLSSTGLIDPATARKLGQIAGVEVLISATVTPFGDSVQIVAKALATTTARIVSASVANVARTRTIEELLNRGIAVAAAGAGAPAAIQPSAPPASDLTKTVAGVTVHLNLCGFNSRGLTCQFTVTSLSEERQLYLVYAERLTRAIDQKGNVYTVEALRLGDTSERGSVKNTLTAGIPMAARIIFANADAGLDVLASLEITLAYDYYGARAPLRFPVRNVRVAAGFPSAGEPAGGRGGK